MNFAIPLESYTMFKRVVPVVKRGNPRAALGTDLVNR